jgi:hypothetical protein
MGSLLVNGEVNTLSDDPTRHREWQPSIQLTH